MHPDIAAFRSLKACKEAFQLEYELRLESQHELEKVRIMLEQARWALKQN